MELGETRISHLNVKVEGLNGQLPNLDLVNLINRLCYREGVGQLFQGAEDPLRPDSAKGFWRYLSTMLKVREYFNLTIPTVRTNCTFLLSFRCP